MLLGFVAFASHKNNKEWKLGFNSPIFISLLSKALLIVTITAKYSKMRKVGSSRLLAPLFYSEHTAGRPITVLDITSLFLSRAILKPCLPENVGGLL